MEGAEVANPGEFTINAVLCDSAVAADGKLYVQGGGWNILTALELHHVQPRTALAIVVAVPYTATNQNHRLELQLQGDDGPLTIGPPLPDGKQPRGIEAQFNVGRPAMLQHGDAQNLPFAVNLDQLRFDVPG